MSAKTTEILREILSLPVAEREELLERLLVSLEPADPKIVELWAAEAEDRVAAFERNEIEAVSADSVFGEIDRQRAR
jgi:putative addiction module component (TIGR02574 family)